MKFHAYERDESGFTMVEIFVVVGIMALLSLIAIPAYLNQRKAAWNSAVQNDVSAAATYIVQNKDKLGGYIDYAGSIPGFTTSADVTINVYGEIKMKAKTSCIEGWNLKSPTDTRWSYNIIEREIKSGSCVFPA